LLSSGVISNLKNKIMPHLFKNSNKTEIAEIKKIFTVLENPFSEFRTEY